MIDTRRRRRNASAPARLTGTARTGAALLASAALMIGHVAPVSAQVTLKDAAQALDATTGGERRITTLDVRGGIGINEFSHFNLDTGDKLRLTQPATASALVNFIDAANGVSQIDGEVTFDALGGGASNAFLVNPSGFVVGKDASINAHNLTFSTATVGAASAAAVAGNTAALGGGDVTFAAGSSITANSLSVWSTGKLVAAGNITVAGASVPSAAPAVTITQRQNATHASVQDGVVRFGVGQAQVSGQITATRNAGGGDTAGGEIWVETWGEPFDFGGPVTDAHFGPLDVTGTAQLSAEGSGAAGGRIVLRNVSALFTDMRAGAWSVSVAGGAVLSATSDADPTGMIAMTGAHLSFGGVLAAPDVVGVGARSISVVADVTTAGGSLTLSAPRIALAEGVTVDTTGATSAGNITALANDISVAANAHLLAGDSGLTAGGGSAITGGRIALIAEDERLVNGLFLASTIRPTARIDIAAAELTAGAVVLSAHAAASSDILDISTASTSQLIYDAISEGVGFGASLDDLSDAIDNGIEQGKKIASAKLPVQIEDIRASATITVGEGATIRADGSWTPNATTPASTVLKADNGYLTKDGLLQRQETFFDRDGLTMTARLAEAYDASRHSLYLHANAETNTTVQPLAQGLGMSLTKARTHSAVSVTKADLTASGGDIGLFSTAFEKAEITLRVGTPSTAATSFIFMDNALTNDVIVNGGSTVAEAGDLFAGAYTAKQHDLYNRAGANQGELALAFTYTTAEARTQAALSGTITADKVDTRAETLYFENTRQALSTLGQAVTLGDLSNSASSKAKMLSTAATLKKILDPDESGTGNKNRIALGFSIDVQLADDQTHASIGSDAVGDSGPMALTGPTVVTADAVNVRADRRFARALEGAGRHALIVKAKMSSMEALIEILKIRSADNGSGFDDKDFGFFASLGIAQIGGQTTARIGGGAEVNLRAGGAGTVTVVAETAYRTPEDLLDFEGRFAAAMRPASLGSIDGTGRVELPKVPDLFGVIDPRQFLTSALGTQSVQSAAAGTDQKAAFGTNVLVYGTDDTTRALVEDGVTIRDASELSVTALTRGVFAHMSADSADSAPVPVVFGGLMPPANAGALIGVGVSVPRVKATTEARVGDVTLTRLGDLTIDARTDIVQAALAKSGGMAKAETLALNVGIVAADVDTRTWASLGAGASVDATGDVAITATDNSRFLSIAGGFNRTIGSVAATAMFGVNDISRDTRAWIGSGTAAPGPVTLTARDVTIHARNTGSALSFGLSLSLAVAASAPDAPAPPPPHLLPGGNVIGTAVGTRVRSGNLAAAFSGAINLFDADITVAEIAAPTMTLNLRDLSLLAESTALDVAGAGAVSAAYGLTSSANLIGFTVAVADARRDLAALLNARKVTARGVSLSARDLGKSITSSVTATGAGQVSLPFVTSNAAAGAFARIEERGATLAEISGAEVTATGDLVVDARNDRDVAASAGAAAVTKWGGGIGGSTALLDSSRDATIRIDGATISANAITLASTSDLYALSLAPSASVGIVSVAATAAVTELTGDTRVDVTGATLTGTDVTVAAHNDDTAQAFAGSLAASTEKAALGGSTANVLRSGTVAATVGNATLSATGSADIAATAAKSMSARAIGLGFSNGLAATLAITVLDSRQTIAATVDQSRVFARDAITLRSDLRDAATSSAMTLAASADGSLAGSGSYLASKNTVATTVQGSKLWAGGTLAVLSSAVIESTMFGGGDELIDVNGAFAASGVGAIGLNTNVITTRNRVSTHITAASDLRGYGRSAVSLGQRLGTRRGVVLDAWAETDLDSASGTVALAGAAAAVGTISVNLLDDSADVLAGSGAEMVINPAGTLRAADADTTEVERDFLRITEAAYDPATSGIDPHAEQDLDIAAQVFNRLDVWAINLAGAGKAAASLSNVTNFVSSRATVRLTALDAAAKRHVSMTSATDLRLSNRSAGLSVGMGAGAASVVYNGLTARADLDVIGAGLSAGGEIALAATNGSTLDTMAGQFGGGGGVGAGAAVVNVDRSQARVALAQDSQLREVLGGTATSPTSTLQRVTLTPSLTAAGDVAIAATTRRDFYAAAISGGAGGAALALSTVVDLIEAGAEIELGSGTAISAQGVSMSAHEETAIDVDTGIAVAGGGVVGGALHYLTLSGGSGVQVGGGASVSARGDMALAALADRRITSDVGVGTLSGVSVTTAISMIGIEGRLSDPRDTAPSDRHQTDAILAGSVFSDDATTTEDDALTGTTGALMQALGPDAGAEAAATENDRRAQSLAADVAGTRPAAPVTGVGVSIGEMARLTAAGKIRIDALARHGVGQNVGLLAVSASDVSATVGLLDLSATSAIILGRGAILSAGGSGVALRALSGNRTGEIAAASEVAALTVAGGVSLGAGVSKVDLGSTARIAVDAGAVIETTATGGTVTLDARREETSGAKVSHIGGAIVGALGISYARAENSGLAEVRVGEAGDVAAARIAADAITITAADGTGTAAVAETSKGSLTATLSGADAAATAHGTTRLTLQQTHMTTPGLASLSALSTARASATAEGLAAAAGGAIVYSLAAATNDAVVATDIGGVKIVAGAVEVLSRMSAMDGANATAGSDSRTFSGAAAGSGTTAEAGLGYAVTTTVSNQPGGRQQTDIAATDYVDIRAEAAGARSDSQSTGKTASGLAIGVVQARSGQTGNRLARVETRVTGGRIETDGILALKSSNAQAVGVTAIAGSGGIVTADVTTARTETAARTVTEIGGPDGVTLLAGDALDPDRTRLTGRIDIAARQEATVNARLDNSNATLAGRSGAEMRGAYASDLDLQVDEGVNAMANGYEIVARNALKRPGGSAILSSRSGGGISGAAVSSTAQAGFDSDVTLDGGAVLTQIGTAELAPAMRISALGDMALADNTTLDVAAVLGLPFGRSDMTARHDGGIFFGDVTIRAAGDLEAEAGGNAAVSARQITTSSGAAGAASAKSFATYLGDSLVTVTGAADLESLKDIDLGAGSVGGAGQTITSTAESRVFNRTLIPITLHPDAVAKATTLSRIDLHPGARIAAYEDVRLSALNGERDVSGFGLAKDFYRELLAAGAKLVGQNLVLDIRTGQSHNVKSSELVVNADVLSGAFNRRVLNFDGSDKVDNSVLPLPDGTGFESEETQPGAEFYSVEISDEIARIVALRDGLIAQLPNVSAATVARYNALISGYDQRLAELGGEGAPADAPGRALTRITVAPIRAAEGSVRMTADTLSGSGSLRAAEEADIRIYARSGAILGLQGLEISTNEGGLVTLNERILDAGATAEGPTVILAPNFGEPENYTLGDNSIQVVATTTSLDPLRDGSIEVNGTLKALQGGLDILTTEGSLFARGNFEVRDLRARAPKGSISLASPDPGVRAVGPTPNATYFTQLRDRELVERWRLEWIIGLNGGRNYGAPVGNVVTETFATPASTVVNFDAARSIEIVGEYVNISGRLRAGIGQYRVNLPAGMQASVDTLAAMDRSGLTRIVRHGWGGDRIEGDTFFTTSLPAETNADVYFNHDTGRMELGAIVLRGGAIRITGDVISTGGGAIEAIDGQGSLSITSDLSQDLVLNTVDLGDGQSQAGLVRIIDLGRPFAHNGKTYFQTTDYRSLGGVMTILSNRNADGSINYIDDPDTPLADEIDPGRVTFTGALNSATFNPVANRDLVFVTQSARLVHMARYKVELVDGRWRIQRDIPLSGLYRRSILPNQTYINNSDRVLGVVGPEQTLFTYTNPPASTYARVQNSVGSYDYRHQFDARTNWIQSVWGNRYRVRDYAGNERAISLPESIGDLSRFEFSHSPFNNDGAAYQNPNRFSPNYNIGTGWSVEKQRFLSTLDSTVPVVKDHAIVHLKNYLFSEVLTHEHRFRADKPVQISFSGGAAADSSVSARGRVVFQSAFRNTAGATSVTSTGGSIVAADGSAAIHSQALTLRAPNGSIGSATTPLPVRITSGLLDAVAGQGVSVHQQAGDLVIRQARAGTLASSDALRLRAQGDLTQEGASSAVAGGTITLTSDLGAIGASVPLVLDTGAGTFTATAQGDVKVTETTGDLRVDTVRSIAGAVTLEAPTGAILDANTAETRDLRTEAELISLWADELGLTDDAKVSARAASHIADLEERMTRAYAVYWAQRGSAGLASYQMDAATRDALIAGLDAASDEAQARVAAHSAEMQRRYASWDTQAAFDMAYAYTATASDAARVAGDLKWSVAELTQNISDGVFAATGDSNTRNEDSNISAAGDIVLTAQTGVGASGAAHVIAAGASLTPADVAALSRALPGDLAVAADGTVTIAQAEDVNLEVTSVPNAASAATLSARTAANDLFLSSQGALRVARLAAPGDVTLGTDGWLTSAAAPGQAAITGRSIAVESGSGAIGSAAVPLVVTTGAGGFLRLAADGDAHVTTTGDAALSAGFSGGLLSLEVGGALTDYLGTETARLIGGGLAISADSIGSAANRIALRQQDPAASVTIEARRGGAFLLSDRDLRLTRLHAPGPISLETLGGATLTLAGGDTIRAGASDTLTLSAGGPVRAEGTTGTDIAAGAATILAAGDLGSAATPLTTALTTLDLAAAPGAAPSAWLGDSGALTVSRIALPTSGALVLNTMGDLTVTEVASGGDIALDSGGALALGPVSARSLTINAVRDVAVAAADLSGGLSVTGGGSVDLTDLTVASADIAGSDVTMARAALIGAARIDAASAVRIADLSAETLSLIANEDAHMTDAALIGAAAFKIVGDATVTSLTASALNLSAGGAATVTDVAFAGAALLNVAGDLSAGNTDAARLDLTSGGTAYLTGARVTGDVALLADGDATVQDLNAAALRLAAAKRGTVTQAAIAGVLEVATGSETSVSEASAATIAIAAGGRAEVRRSTSLQDITGAAEAALAASDLNAGGAISLDAGGAIDAARLTAHSLSLGAGQSAVLTSLSADAGLKVTAGAAVRLDSAESGAASLTSGADMTLTTVAAGGLSATAGGALQARGLTDTGATRLEAAGGALVSGIDSRSLALVAGGDAVVNDAAIGTTMDLTASAAELTRVMVEDLTATTEGALSIMEVSALRISASAAGDLRLGRSSADVSARLSADGGLDIATLNAGTLLATSGAGATATDAAVGGDASLTVGGDLELSDLTAATLTLAGGGAADVADWAIATNASIAAAGALSLRRGKAAKVTASGHSLDAGDLTVTGAAEFIAVGDASFAVVEADGIEVTASGSLTAADLVANGDLTLQAGADADLSRITADSLTLSAGGPAQLAHLAVGGAAEITAAGPLEIRAFGADRLSATAQSIEAQDVEITRSATIEASAQADLWRIVVADLSARAGGAVTVRDITGRAQVAIFGGATLVADLVAADQVVTEASGDVTASRIAASGTLSVTAGGGAGLFGVDAQSLIVAAQGEARLEETRLGHSASLSARRLSAVLTDSDGATGLDLSVAGHGGAHAESALVRVLTEGDLRVSRSRITQGDLITTGPRLAVETTNIGSVWFRLPDLDLLAERRFTGLYPEAEIQILSPGRTGVPAGDVAFVMESGLRITTDNVVSNRRLTGILINGSRRYTGDMSMGLEHVARWYTRQGLGGSQGTAQSDEDPVATSGVTGTARRGDAGAAGL